MHSDARRSVVQSVVLTGFITGLGIIASIGAQNAFVLKQALKRQHLRVMLAICVLSDVLLILGGIAAVAYLDRIAPWFTVALTWAGVAFLTLYGIHAARSALFPAADATPATDAATEQSVTPGDRSPAAGAAPGIGHSDGNGCPLRTGAGTPRLPLAADAAPADGSNGTVAHESAPPCTNRGEAPSRAPAFGVVPDGTRDAVLTAEGTHGANRAGDVPGGGAATAVTTPASGTTTATRDRVRTPMLPVVLTLLALTYLNPHVYVDVIVLLGTLANSYGLEGRWWFGAGAIAASAVWFSSLVFAASRMSRFFRSQRAWRCIDGGVSLLMFALAGGLVLHALS
nr:LysE family transporter [Sediminivirga luteola]